DAVIAGRSALLHSDGAVKVTDGVTAGGEVTITSVRGGITMGTGIESSGLFDNAAINGDVTLSASGDSTLPLITAGNGAITGSGHDLTLGQLSSRSEEHTSELQSRENLVCRLLLEKKNNASTP